MDDIKVYDVVYDKVIGSFYLTVGVTYRYALERFVPLINKLNFQRNPLRKSFYQRLENDILAGCIMPNITLAIKDETKELTEEFFDENYVRNNICNAFVLDGIQRLNTMQRVANEDGFPFEQKLYCNILVCNSMDKLLYRMITLNNGQKPMTARHQIEILAGKVFDFESLPILAVTEKDGRLKKNEEVMSKEILIKGYLAYISNSVNIDNQKIIESKMNELIAEQIMDSNIPNKDGEFNDVIALINEALDDEVLNAWFKVPNNFIGFCAAMNRAYHVLSKVSMDELRQSIDLFEDAFSALDVSKIKLGMARRKLVQSYFQKYEQLSVKSVGKLIDYISMEI